jgi:hypothetical protein
VRRPGHDRLQSAEADEHGIRKKRPPKRLAIEEDSMMTYLRGVLSVVLFVLLSAIAIAAAVQTVTLGLPENMTSTSAALLQALVSQDVSRTSDSDKVKLGDRVQREFSEDVDWRSEIGALAPEERERLVQNVTELAIASFDSKVDRFFREREDRRKRFIDRQIDEIVHWAVVLDRVSRTEGDPLVGPAALAGLMGRVGQWYSGASPEKLARLQTFQKAVSEQLPKRLMRRLRPNEN